MNATTNYEAVEKIMQEHAALRSKVGRIHVVLAQPQPADDEIEELLCEFLNVLMVHFSNEEDDGFFDEVIVHAPRLAGQAGKLCVEHRQLLREVDELCRFAAAGSPSVLWWRELSSRCHEFTQRFMRHEREEHKLVQEAHQAEIGA